MNAENINPYIRFASKCTLTNKQHILPRIIFDYELILVEEGEWLLEYNKRSYVCVPDTVLLLRPGSPHAIHIVSEKVSQPHIHFDLVHKPESAHTPISFKPYSGMTVAERALISEDLLEDYPDLPILKVGDMTTFKNLFFRVIDTGPMDNPLVRKARFMELLAFIIDENFPDLFIGESKRSHAVVREIKSFVDAGLAFHMGLDAFAEQYHYSKFYISKQFKTTYGVGLMAYLREKRMEMATELLKTLSVSDVAWRVGYASVFSFSRAYKAHYGRTPSDDRK